jgi:hypothetical protein
MPRKKPTSPPAWRNRIVGHAEVDPQTLLAHPDNWRVHPDRQQQTLEGLLDELGWLQTVMVNQQTGRIVDGHLRVSLALQHGEPTIPVDYVDLTPEEEALILATFDQLTTLATPDPEALSTLLTTVATGNAAVMDFVSHVAENAGLLPDDPPEIPFKEYDEAVAETVEMLECPTCGYRFAA